MFSKNAIVSMIVTATVCLANQANAALQYDQNVTSAGDLYYGAGNLNGGFTVFQDSNLGLELGLRAHTRFPDPHDTAAGIMSQGNGFYGSFAAQGFGTLGNRASWNFDFSINSNYNGHGGVLAPSGLHYVLLIDYDPGEGTNFLQVDPLNSAGPISDNGYGTNSSFAAIGNVSTSAALAAANNVAQDSEQLNFFVGPQAFNPNVNGIYTISLLALNANNQLAGETDIRVIVGAVPEPASMAIWGLGALGCAIAGYRRRRLA